MKRTLKNFCLCSLITGFAIITTMISFAGQWEQNGEQWKYKNDNGSYATNSWEQISDEYYYFDENGVMLSATITPDGYVVNEKGAWIQGVATSAPVVDGWVNQEKAKKIGETIKPDGYDGNPISIYSSSSASYGTSSASAITLNKTSDGYEFNIYVKLNNSTRKEGLKALCMLIGSDWENIYYTILTDYESEIIKPNISTELNGRSYTVTENNSYVTYIVR